VPLCRRPFPNHAAPSCSSLLSFQEAHKRRAEAKARKEANRKKSEIVQRVSSATAKRMLKSKKQRKLLKSGDG
jgi:hypothetical protein